MSRPTQHLDGVLADVRAERYRQEKLWLGSSAVTMSTLEALPVLIEEVGEVAEAMLRFKWENDLSAEGDIYVELVQVAAVACAMAESLVGNDN